MLMVRYVPIFPLHHAFAFLLIFVSLLKRKIIEIECQVHAPLLVVWPFVVSRCA